MITHRVLQLNFEFKAEIRAGKSERLQIFGVCVRCFDGILPTHEYRDSLFAMASFREEQVKSPLLKLSRSAAVNGQGLNTTSGKKKCHEIIPNNFQELTKLKTYRTYICMLVVRGKKISNCLS